MKIVRFDVQQADAPLSSDDIIDIAVKEINRIQRKKNLEAATETGRYVLDLFFDGSSAVFRVGSKSDHSYRRLSRHEDLEISSTKLWYSVAIVEHLENWPSDIFWPLSFSHHKYLIPIKDKAARLDVATRAAEQGWSVRRLRSEITRYRELHEEPSAAGRPPKSLLDKIVDRISREFEHLRQQADPTVIESQSAVDVRCAITKVELVVHGMNQVLQQLRKTAARLDDGRY